MVCPCTEIFTTEGITFDNMGARLGNWALDDDTDSAAVAVAGSVPTAIARLSANALNINDFCFIAICLTIQSTREL
ncbi:hypothetical protein DZS_35500 [Dickeya ananatis]